MISRTDISMSGDNKIITNRFDFILQEISVLFDTDTGEVLGDNEFGTNFENFLWDLSISNSEIPSYVYNKIINDTMSGADFDIGVNTKIVNAGDNGDIILVQITIKDRTSGEATDVTYKIE